jgi:hypothetical protein
VVVKAPKPLQGLNSISDVRVAILVDHLPVPKLDWRALSQGLEALRLDGTEMNPHVFSDISGSQNAPPQLVMPDLDRPSGYAAASGSSPGVSGQPPSRLHLRAVLHETRRVLRCHSL